jgi:phosphoenolpyruvate carboxykinase (ATP)
MHCSANVGPAGDVALYFGLSGTGKTTLSADPGRELIGDDEHGWSDNGVFNFEGGCYAKMIRLSPESEPEIYATVSRFGTVLENVVIDPETHAIDLADESLTENTRGAYPLSSIPRAVEAGLGGHPSTILFLTCDAFGIMPPIARLDETQTMYHFLAGYTAKVAGTEKGIVEPQATFSTCFGAPFMARMPESYADLLRKRIRAHGSRCWLVNTGWSGGPYGVGSRMPIKYTRALVNAAIDGKLDGVPTRPDPIFGFQVPERVEGIPAEIMDPRRTWKDPAAFDAKARELATLFTENFKLFTGPIAREVAPAGPKA